MPVLADYTRFRWTWGGIDFQHGTDSPYDTSQTGASLGTSAAAGAGVGVRRCVLHFDRTALIAGADDAETHFDFLNITGGDPDDTWTSGDYTTLEGYLDDFWAAIKGKYPTGLKLAGYHWYRHGPGVGSPNPAERVTSRSVAGTSGGAPQAPQDACTITFRTAVRRSWGRAYLPGPSSSYLGSTGSYQSSGLVDVIATAAGDLVSAAIGSDFPLVVVSAVNSATFNVEAVEVDDLVDIQRRRRWKAPAYRNIIST